MSKNYCMHCMMPMRGEEQVCKSCGQTNRYVAPVHHIKCGTVLRDKYLIGKALGEGGFGVTYIGRDMTLDMRIAIKEYFPSGCANRNNCFTNKVTMTQGNQGIDYEKDMQRFLNEARVLARFSDESGVVGVRDFFQENGTAYIVMEYLDGITLKDYIQAYGPFPTDKFLLMIDPILQTLSDIHKQGLIHRDISPDNIMMLKNGRLKLLDFGAAREVAEDKSLSVMLKFGYAPEEQYRSKGKHGSWTDVYAMCATIYKCITGVTPDESIQRVFDDELKAPSKLGIPITANQEYALMQGLKVRCSERIQTMDELRIALALEKAEDIKGIQIYQDDKEAASPETDKTVLLDKSKMVQDVTAKDTKPKRVVICLAVVIVLIVIGVILGTVKRDTSNQLADTIPTLRMMASGCNTLLKQEGITGTVLDVQAKEENLNEKFKTYVVTCEVTVSENDLHSNYTLDLYYEYEDEKWVLGKLSGIK